MLSPPRSAATSSLVLKKRISASSTTACPRPSPTFPRPKLLRSEEHTSELQSQSNLVCRLLLEKKKNQVTHNSALNEFVYMLMIESLRCVLCNCTCMLSFSGDRPSMNSLLSIIADGVHTGMHGM